MRKIEQNAHQK